MNNSLSKKLGQALEKLEIKNLVWDLDGTLIDTRSIFIEIGQDVGKILSQGHQFDEKECVKIFEETIWSLRSEMGVKPAIMFLSLDISRKRLGLGKNDVRVVSARKRIEELYNKDVPDLFPDALEIIEVFNSQAIDPFLMTHAEEEWTWLKLSQNDLIGKFKEVVCFTVDRAKSEQWGEKFEVFGLNPKETLVIGDNLLADILPTLSLGCYGVLVERNKKPFGMEDWDGKDQEKEIWKVDQLKEIPRLLVELANESSL